MPTHVSTNSLLELADTTETLALLSLELSSPSWTASTSSVCALRRNPSCSLQVRPIRAAVVGFLDEGRQGDASQLQQEDPPRVVQRGGHKLLRLLRHQIRGADDAAFSFARPAPRCGALQPAPATSSSYAASVRWTAKTTETAMSSS